MKKLVFYKMEAIGNDFVVIDNRKKAVKKPVDFAREVCNRNTGIGADGLLLVEPSRSADFRMRILNADGSEAEMCGNGSRCMGLFACKVLKMGKKLVMETLAGKIGLEVGENAVKVGLSDPRDFREKFNLDVDGEIYPCYFINTGVPHAVLFVYDIEHFPVESLGEKIRYHKEFAPKGTNVNFVKAESDSTIMVKTYERGVGLTRACGTGVTASAIVSVLIGKCKPPVRVKTPGGVLKVDFQYNNGKVSGVTLEGGARIAFKGEYF